MRLAHKVALVTGAGSGIGAACADLVVANGGSVLYADLDAEKAEARAAGGGSKTLATHVDVRSTDSLVAARDLAMDRFGRLDILIASAGVAARAVAHECPAELWENIIDVNLTGVFKSIKAVLPVMMEAQSGVIVAIASIGGVVGVPRIPAYAASKGGVISLCRQLAVDYAAYGIRINTVSPGSVETALGANSARILNLPAPTGGGHSDEDYPLGGRGSPTDVASSVVYLASDDARWVTGTNLIVDGGFTAR